MDSMKMKLLDELLEYLASRQGKGLKSLVDSKNMPMESEKVEVESKPEFDKQAEEAMEEAVPEAKLPGEEEMSDDELEELLKKHLS